MSWLERRWRRHGTAAASVTVSPTSARVAAGMQLTQQALAVHWWHYRHLFLEAKRAALYERLHPGEDDADPNDVAGGDDAAQP